MARSCSSVGFPKMCAVIPMAIYKNNCDTQTLTVGTQLVVTDKVSEELAFRIN